jgi:hypothetical protein
MENRALIRWMLTCALCLIYSLDMAGAARSVPGTVVDADGRPVSHAYVEARPVLSKFSPGTVVGNTPNP